VIKQTGRTNVDTFRKNLKISLPEAKELRQSMIDDGLLIKKGNTYVLQEAVGEVENAVLRPGNIEDNVRETAGGSDVLPPPRQAPAGPISSGPESVAVDRAVEPASNIVDRETGVEAALEPAQPRRTVNESTRAEVLRAFAALEAEQAGTKPPEAAAQQGLELLGGTAKPVLSSAESKILEQLKSAAVYLNSTGKINADERTQINAEVRKSKPDLAKLKKLIDKKFPKRLYELKIGSDDGGRMIDIIVDESKLSRAIRDFMPLNWEGWRTVVINRYTASGAE
jgi:hypothetical protein